MSKQVSPLQKSIIAKPHTPVYRMHRYFARRPYSVFAELINHYSNAGDIVLDPFCGGGVTLVEGVLQGRNVIGFDINPLATFITRMQLKNVDLTELKGALEKVMKEYKREMNQLFCTSCDSCGLDAEVNWFEYSAETRCNNCGTAFLISESQKSKVGTWVCPNPSCKSFVRFSPRADTKYALINLYYSCTSCGHLHLRNPNRKDMASYHALKSKLTKAEASGLSIPNIDFPDCNMQRESALFKKGIFKFRQFFTDRHLLALAKLKAIIIKQDSPLREWLLFVFSSTLRYTNRMVTRNTQWRGNRPFEWAKPGFWLPPVHLEANVLREFERRGNAIIRGKKDYLTRFSARVPKEHSTPKDAINSGGYSFFVGTSSSTELPLKENSIDVIITDPPYGSYVQYADLCNFWSVWLPEIDGLGDVINTDEEAVIARKKFPGAKMLLTTKLSY